MKKRMFALLALTLAALLVVSACSSDNGGSTGSTTTTGSSTTTGSDTPTVSIDDMEFEDKDFVGEVSDEVVAFGNYTPPGDPVTFSLFVADTGQGPSSTNPIINMIQDMTGVTIEFEFLVGDLDQKVGVMLASGDFPDIINPGNARARFIDSGALVPLDDLLGGYPNLAKHYGPFMDKIRAGATDGRSYIMDIWGRYYWYGDNIADYLDDFNQQAFWVQKEVVAGSGYQIPKTLDEFFDMIETYYAANPTIDDMPAYPFEIFATTGALWGIANPPQHLVGGGNDGDAFVKTEALEGKPEWDHLGLYEAEIYHNKWYAKDYYEKLNGAYKRGLISPEAFTQTKDQYMAKIAQGRVLSMFDAHWHFQNSEDLLIAEDKLNRTYVPFGLVYDGYTQGYMDTPKSDIIGNNGIGITTSCKDVDRVLTYLDTLLNEDIQRLLTWGVVDEDFYITEEGRYMMTPEQHANTENTDWRITNSGRNLHSQLPKIQGMYSDGNAAGVGTQPEMRAITQKEYDKEFYSHFGWSMKSGFLVPTEKADYFPVWSFTMPRGSDARTALSDIQDTAIRYLPPVVMADDFESAWAEYLGYYERLNYKAYEEEVNKQIAERMGINR